MIDAGSTLQLTGQDSMERQHCWLLWQNIWKVIIRWSVLIFRQSVMETLRMKKICCCVFKRDIDIRIRYTRRYQKYFVTFGGWKREKCNLISVVSYVVAVVQNFRKPLVLIIDEVDTATNNQVFVDFWLNCVHIICVGCRCLHFGQWYLQEYTTRNVKVRSGRKKIIGRIVRGI